MLVKNRNFHQQFKGATGVTARVDVMHEQHVRPVRGGVPRLCERAEHPLLGRHVLEVSLMHVNATAHAKHGGHQHVCVSAWCVCVCVCVTGDRPL